MTLLPRICGRCGVSFEASRNTLYCPTCKPVVHREKHAARMARYKAAPHRRGYAVTADDLLTVSCWCEAMFVGVPAADVKAGQTRSCGLTGCEAS